MRRWFRHSEISDARTFPCRSKIDHSEYGCVYSACLSWGNSVECNKNKNKFSVSYESNRSINARINELSLWFWNDEAKSHKQRFCVLTFLSKVQRRLCFFKKNSTLSKKNEKIKNEKEEQLDEIIIFQTFERECFDASVYSWYIKAFAKQFQNY